MGLPASYWPMVQKIPDDLPIFMYNYSDGKLHGVWRSQGAGGWQINPRAWQNVRAGRSQGPKEFPAQVRVARTRQAAPLRPEEWQPALSANLLSPRGRNRNGLVVPAFELDMGQTRELVALFNDQPALAGGAPPPSRGASPVPSPASPQPRAVPADRPPRQGDKPQQRPGQQGPARRQRQQPAQAAPPGPAPAGSQAAPPGPAPAGSQAAPPGPAPAGSQAAPQSSAPAGSKWSATEAALSRVERESMGVLDKRGVTASDLRGVVRAVLGFSRELFDRCREENQQLLDLMTVAVHSFAETQRDLSDLRRSVGEGLAGKADAADVLSRLDAKADKADLREGMVMMSSLLQVAHNTLGQGAPAQARAGEGGAPSATPPAPPPPADAPPRAASPAPAPSPPPPPGPRLSFPPQVRDEVLVIGGEATAAVGGEPRSFLPREVMAWSPSSGAWEVR